jgi:cell wall-associated NlpC family hydrolase
MTSMGGLRCVMVACLTCFLTLAAVPTALGSESSVPKWVRPAVRYLAREGHLDKKKFHANRPMKRKAFRTLMRRAFRAGLYNAKRGRVTAREVSLALVKALHRRSLARRLRKTSSPDGWRPRTRRWFGSEIVARELGLRRDRPTNEDVFEASPREAMRQADIAWAVWKAKTAPAFYAADALGDFKLSKYDKKRRKVVQFATSLVGAPYVWAGEWPVKTPNAYPYGAQVHGGFDCSGFVWYVLRAKARHWHPIDRPYEGWKLKERSSSGMAAGARRKLKYKKLRPTDILFFAPGGRKAKARSIYHAGLYLGRGWMIHSSGSRAGISLADVSPGSWWHDQFAWGRRVVKS